MGRPRTKDHHLLPGVRLIGSSYYYQSTRNGRDGKRQHSFLAKTGDEDTMRSEWAKLHPHQVTRLLSLKISIDEPMVYFVKIDRAVKIGYTASKAGLAGRMITYRTGSPKPVKLIGAVPGERDSEKRAHRALAQHSISGEWFALRAPVISFINHALTIGRIPD